MRLTLKFPITLCPYSYFQKAQCNYKSAICDVTEGTHQVAKCNRLANTIKGSKASLADGSSPSRPDCSSSDLILFQRNDAHSSLLGNADISCYPAPLCVCDGKRGPPGAHYRSCQMIVAEWRLPRDTEHVVSAATRRQRQMAWVPAAGMSVIPQRERERSGRECGGEERREEERKEAVEEGV